MSTLRKALGDRGAERRYIETVSRAGYRFTAEVARRPAFARPSTLLGTTLSLSKGRASYGELRRGRPAPHGAFPMRWPIGVLPAQPAVSELIGRGRSHLLTMSIAEIPKAVAAFRSAIQLDPTYAASHAGLARACCVQAELRLVPHAEAYAEARTAALRALAMDDACADAQVALATVLFLSDWNWTGARRSVERAIDLDPDHTEAYLLYGRLAEAFGDFDRQMAESLTHAESYGVPAEALAELEQVYATGGRRAVVHHTIRRASSHPASAVQLAVLHGELGNLDEAFHHLDAAIEHRDPCLVHLAVAPQWDGLRPDPRFEQHLERMGLTAAGRLPH